VISAGNDIIDLSQVDKDKTCQHKFYSKILSSAEQVLYQQTELAALPFAHYVWLLWSVKESAYKFLKRNQPELLFSPIKIVVESIDIYEEQQSSDSDFLASDNKIRRYKGKLTSGKQTLYFRSNITDKWIASFVNHDERFENVHVGVQTIDEQTYLAQSTSAKTLLIKSLNVYLKGAIDIEKSTIGYPMVFCDSKKTDIAASLSHSGIYVSYAFNLCAI